MFEQKLIFQEGDASAWLLLHLAGIAVAFLIIGVRILARFPADANQRKPVGMVGIITEVFAVLMLLGFGWQLWRMNLSGWFWFALIATLIAGGLILALLQYERKLVPKAVGNTLLVLRLLVLIVFFLTLLKPALTKDLDKTLTGRILVAVDVSESMATKDSHGSPAEKLRWARTLGLIGGAGDVRVESWQKSLDRGEEPEWVGPEETNDPDRRRVLEASRKKQLDDVFAQLDEISRKEIAKRLLVSTSNPLLPRLEDIGTLEFVVFGGKSESADTESLSEFLEEPPVSVLPQFSDLTQGLSPKSSSESEMPLMGVVLLTDGRDNTGYDASRIATRLGNVNAPVLPIILGSERRPKDLAIGHLEFPQVSFKKDKRILTAVLNTSGFEDQEVTVTLTPTGEEPITKTLTPNKPDATLTFELETEEVGRHEYNLTIEPQEGETRKDNNSRRFAITIVDDKVKVLVTEGEARWEFRYLTNALYRDEGVGRENVKEVVFHQPYLGILSDTWFPRTLKLPDDPEDLSQSPFAEPDVIIIGDVAEEDIPEEGWKLLERFVSEAGGTLVLEAGKNDFPIAHTSPTLSRLLPITNPREMNFDDVQDRGSPTERGFHLRLTPDGERETMFQFDATSTFENARIWQNLPGHTWGIFGDVKPNATVFVSADLGQGDFRLRQERENAIIVHQYLGTGQVLWLGIDSTWRWRHRVGDDYHHRFWGQLGRWATRNKATAGNEVVRFGLQRTEVEFGEDAILQARWSQKFLTENPNLDAKVKLFRRTIDDEGNAEFESDAFSTLDLESITTGSLLYEARAIALPPGEYRAVLDAPNAAIDDEEISTTFYVHDKPTLELSDLSANRKLLQQLANLSNGRLYYPHELDSLPDRLLPPEYRDKSRAEIELWDSWPMLIVFFVLLTLEWFVRKLNGLP